MKYWRSYNFDEHVLDPAKAVSNPPEMNFSKHQFTELITDKEIMDHFQISKSSGLMTREEILWAIASLTSKQPKGEAGALLNNGHSTIIGYMICNGVVRYVRADWVFGNARWYCYCNDLDDVWRAGNGVLSRS